MHSGRNTAVAGGSAFGEGRGVCLQRVRGGSLLPFCEQNDARFRKKYLPLRSVITAFFSVTTMSLSLLKTHRSNQVVKI